MSRKIPAANKSRVTRSNGAIGFAVVALLLASVSTIRAQPGNAGNPLVLPPDSNPYGKSYGEWSAEWWKWAFSLRTDNHPLFDTGDCSAGQSGRVWFLGGTFIVTEIAPSVVVGKAERNCSVPTGTALFFPILNNEQDNVGVEPPHTVTELYRLVHAAQDHAVLTECTIDGRAVNGLSDPFHTPYRVVSPVFSLVLPPEKNLYQFFGLDVAGPIAPAVADGVFLMVAPLPAGQHVIHFSGRSLYTLDADGFDLDFSLDITFHLTLVPGNR